MIRKSNLKADDGFGTLGKVDAGYYSQGFFFFFYFNYFQFVKH